MDQSEWDLDNRWIDGSHKGGIMQGKQPADMQLFSLNKTLFDTASTLLFSLQLVDMDDNDLEMKVTDWRADFRKSD